MTDYPSDIFYDIFKKYPEIEAVYMFGSAARGKTHGESDLDLAILPADASIKERKLDILAELAREGFCQVDLVFLDEDDIVLQYEAVRQNKLVYHVGDFDRGETYSRIVRKYLDFCPYLQVQRQRYKERVLNDSRRGHSKTTE